MPGWAGAPVAKPERPNMSIKKAPAKKAAPAAKAKDLKPKKDAKGGLRGTGYGGSNHNETLVGDAAR